MRNEAAFEKSEVSTRLDWVSGDSRITVISHRAASQSRLFSYIFLQRPGEHFHHVQLSSARIRDMAVTYVMNLQQDAVRERKIMGSNGAIIYTLV